MGTTVRETIKKIVYNHLIDKKGKCYGQCLTAVGWVGGTLPELYEIDGMIELPMADVAGGAIVTGAALSGSKPIYVVRYQGFQWYNCVSIINYACKSLEIWKKPCPVMIRSIAMEGGIGPVAGSSHHSIYFRMPGIKIVSPMTPGEYKLCYESFSEDNCPYYFSEHRKSYDNSVELFDSAKYDNPDFTIFAISITRFEMQRLEEIAKESNISINIFHLVWLKPLRYDTKAIDSLRNSKFCGIIIDDDFINGSQSSIGNYFSNLTSKPVIPMGLKEISAGFHPKVDNLPPTAEEVLSKLKQIKLKSIEIE
jgi:pyruvate/2-oxoglutarate/acetoin dehydrogenase E1 component